MNLKESIAKNMPELQALLTGGMPSFVYGVNKFKDIPVFCLHAANKEPLEEQFLNLIKNGYITLNGEELLERLDDKNYRNNGKEIVLTFDDGLASVWTVGFPLLEKYELKIIAFVLPGLIEEGEKVGLTIKDHLSAEEHSYVINRDSSSSPLCNWKELIVMHDSGLVDIQSHGMQHSLISVSSKIVDFIHPKFDTNNYGNVHVPLYLDENKMQTRKAVWGHPVFMSESRLNGKVAFWDSSESRAACAQFVQNNGGAQFFTKNDWKKQLLNIYNSSKNKSNSSGFFESKEETENAMLSELKTSKRIIEEKLNKQVKHFCFPWYQANNNSVDMAYESGFEAIHLGITNGFNRSSSKEQPYLVHRLVDDYLDGLPGMGKNLVGVLKSKFAAGKKRRMD